MQKSNRKRVFILGAGFSKQAGMPLATELTPLLRRPFDEDDDREALDWLNWLDERVRWLKRTDNTEVPSLNIEELFDFAYFDALLWKMRQHLCPLGRNWGDTPHASGEAIDTWLSYMEDALCDVIWNQQQACTEKSKSISRFTDLLRDTDTIITFNYDTLIEQSLLRADKSWHYGFETQCGQGTLILKMHGSINWAIVPRDQIDCFGYPLLFKKEDKNKDGSDAKPTGEVESDYCLLQIPDDRLANRIQNRILQRSNKRYDIGIAGLGRYKPLDQISGSGQVWYNAGRALYQADEIYVVGFSLSPFDTMARLHFAGVICKRRTTGKLPTRIMLVDPSACSLKANFQGVFGTEPLIETIQEFAENMNWEQLLRIV